MTSEGEADSDRRQVGPRDYTAGTRAGLVLLSQGTCYFPGCTTRTIEFIDGETFVNFQIAHVRDAKPGNRYGAAMTDDERRSFANLVLLCKPHHTLVDKTHPERYSIEDLEQWKSEREGAAMGSLRGLHDLTEERLEDMIRRAVSALLLPGTWGLVSANSAGRLGRGAHAIARPLVPLDESRDQPKETGASGQ